MGNRITLNRRELTEIYKIGDRLLRELRGRCAETGDDPSSGSSRFWMLDQFEGALGWEAPDVETRALNAYIGASLGRERKRRPRPMAWLDGDGKVRTQPPPWPAWPPKGIRLCRIEDQQTTTDEALLEQVGAPQHSFAE